MTVRQQVRLRVDPAKMLLHQAEDVICMRYGDSVSNNFPLHFCTMTSEAD